MLLLEETRVPEKTTNLLQVTDKFDGSLLLVIGVEHHFQYY